MGFRRIGNLRPNRLPELKSLLRRYPDELETRVGHYELHRASTKKFNKITLVKISDPLVRQRAALIPKAR